MIAGTIGTGVGATRATTTAGTGSPPGAGATRATTTAPGPELECGNGELSLENHATAVIEHVL